MKILIFNWRDITNPWAGGAEVHIHELAKRWAKMGHKVTLLCGGYPLGLPWKREETIDGVRIIRRGGTYSIYFLAPFFYLLKLRSQFDCIIDVAHGGFFFTPLFTRKPVVGIIHQSHAQLFPEAPFPINIVGPSIENRIVPAFYRNVPIITLSKANKKRLTGLGFRKTKIVPPGVDLTKFTPGQGKTNSPSILYLGRLRRYKRVGLLIKAAAKLRSKIPNLSVTIAGDGHERENLKKLVKKLNLSKTVNLRGFVSEEEKTKLLQHSWLLAVPSVAEGWGLVATEANACGTPVVAFKVPGLTEAVKQNQSGVLVANQKEFLDVISDLLTNKERRENLSLRAIRWAKQFTWEKAASASLEACQEAILEKNWQFFSHPVNALRAWYIKNFLKPRSLLDVGCGQGWLVEFFRRKGIESYGLDNNRLALSQIPPKTRSFCKLGSILSIPYPKGSFDVVTCVDVLEHLPNQDLCQAIQECFRVAQRVVYLDITVLEDFLFIHRDPTHVSKFFSWQWGKIIKGAIKNKGEVKRGPILPFIHHGVFLVEKKP